MHMQTLYGVVFGIFVILGYFSNPKNIVNRWYCVAGIFFWIGAIKQALLDEIIPYLESTFKIIGLSECYAPIHAIFTWILYTLAMPSMLIAVVNLSNYDKIPPKQMKLLKIVLYVPGIILLFFFSPLLFTEYQKTSSAFWLTYAVYNFSFGIPYAHIAIRGFSSEKNLKSRKQKQRVALLFLPLLCYWLITVFIPRIIDSFFGPFDPNSVIFDIWQANAYLMIVVLVIFIFLAFRDGFMGLKLLIQRYNWNDNMDLINISAEYTNHMFKQQVSTMELCVKQLNEYYISADSNPEVIERLNIMSRSILTLRNFVDRIKRHSQIIRLTEESCRITDLLADAVSPIKDSGIQININIPDTLFLVCDKVHMTEVFTNIITNSSEAIVKNGIIEITGAYEKPPYRLMFRDNGEGIDPDMLNDIFRPHFSTKKSKEKNFGLGLYYCRNVMAAHGGSIMAKSIKGKGATIIITLPSRRVAMSGAPVKLR